MEEEEEELTVPPRDGDRGSSGYRSREGDGDSLPDSDHWATSTDNNWTDYDQEVRPSPTPASPAPRCTP